MDQIVITSTDKESTVVVDSGELVSYSKYGEELIHQKGDRGWRNSDTEMFPIIGPVNEAGFQVQVPDTSIFINAIAISKLRTFCSLPLRGFGIFTRRFYKLIAISIEFTEKYSINEDLMIDK